MAIPLLLRELPDQYEDLIQRRLDEGRRLSGLEHELFGWDHADAAAMLAKRWNLPETFVELIGHHTRLADLLDGGDSQRGNACVALASLLPSCSEAEWAEQDEFVDGYARLTNGDGSSLQDMFVSVDESTAEFAPLLKLPTPKKSLTDYISETA